MSTTELDEQLRLNSKRNGVRLREMEARWGLRPQTVNKVGAPLPR